MSDINQTENFIIQKLLHFRTTGCDEYLKDVLEIFDCSSNQLNYDLVRIEISLKGLKKEWETEKRIYFLRLVNFLFYFRQT